MAKRSLFKLTTISVVAIALLALSYLGARYLIYSPINILENDIAIDIYPDATHIDSVTASLVQKKVITHPSIFKGIASLMSFQPRSGRFLIPKGKRSHYDLIGILRGKQMTINLAIHNHRTINQLTQFVANKTTIRKFELDRLLSDELYLDSIGFTTDNIMSLFIPNTYELYWNTTAEDFVKRMVKEHTRFWNPERTLKLERLKLNKQEVYALASIVECETQFKGERRRIAGVYMNRLQKRGWKLEADPTVIFAIGDFEIRRVLKRHLLYDSPYNTYKYPGLPPGPIYMASINSIDAVLNYEEHDYMFFCAKPKLEGRPTEHAFSKTLRGHMVNARKYQRWLRNNIN